MDQNQTTQNQTGPKPAPIDVETTFGHPTFIVGCPRSGTTWAASVFQKHPTAVTTLESALLDCLREPWWRRFPPPSGPRPPLPEAELRRAERLERFLVWPRPPWYDAWRDVFVRYHGGGAKPGPYLRWSAGLWSGTVWTRLRSQLVPMGALRRLIRAVESEMPDAERDTKVAHVFLRALERFYRRHDGEPGGALVEKTPSHLFHAEVLLERLPGARLIEIVRDGRDVCVSMDHFQPWMPAKRRAQAREWRNYIEEGRRLAADPRFADRILTVRFEAMKADPEAEIGRMLEHAGLEATPEMCRRLREETRISKRKDRGEGELVRKGAVGDWRDEFSDEDVEIFREEAGEALESVGYGW